MITWTKLRAGLWNGSHNGALVAMVELDSTDMRQPYRYKVRCEASHCGWLFGRRATPQAARDAADEALAHSRELA